MKNYAMRFPGVLILLALVAACATNKYASVVPGVTSLGEFRVTIGEGWLRAPASVIPEERSASRTLTRENLERDRLMLIPGVSDGQSIFRDQNNATPLPLFAANMNFEQIAAMVGQSMQQALWNGSATVAIKDARDHCYGSIAGFVVGGTVFPLLKTGSLKASWFAGGSLEPIVAWVESQAVNPFACATLGAAASVTAMVVVSLMTTPPSDEHLKRVYGS